jgi:hypothetical protein
VLGHGRFSLWGQRVGRCVDLEPAASDNEDDASRPQVVEQVLNR